MMIPVRIAGTLSFVVGAYLGIRSLSEAESIVGRIGTAVRGDLVQGAAQLLVGGVALIVIGIIMMFGDFRRVKV